MLIAFQTAINILLIKYFLTNFSKKKLIHVCLSSELKKFVACCVLLVKPSFI